jgi:hypothetical protein
MRNGFVSRRLHAARQQLRRLHRLFFHKTILACHTASSVNGACAPLGGPLLSVLFFTSFLHFFSSLFSPVPPYSFSQEPHNPNTDISI